MVRFVKDNSLFIKKSFGMYAVPAAVKIKDRVILMIGNSKGKLYMFEIRNNNRNTSVKRLKFKIELASKSFLSPSFVNLLKKDRIDLVLADGDGMLTYFQNNKDDFTVWEQNSEIFNNRIFAGLASTPTISYMKDRLFMVVGNIDGTFKLYEFKSESEGLPWVEREGYLNGIKVSGFSRGILTHWSERLSDTRTRNRVVPPEDVENGREILITGESSGDIKAFLNIGSGEMPVWKEEGRFFKGVRVNQHSTPTVFDLDGDGKWELITGAENGRIYAYRIKKIINGMPVWVKIKEIFSDIKVNSFSTPAILNDSETLYLFIGQQDGIIRTYTAELNGQKNISFDSPGKIIFRERNFLRGIKMNNHTSPFVRANNGVIELISGDYDGNLRHFTCDAIL